MGKQLEKLKPILVEMGACREAIEWAANRRISMASWRQCERGDWMLWLANKACLDRKLIIAACCDIAEIAVGRYWKNTQDTRPADCVAITKLWLADKATIKEVRTAAYAAYAARAVYAAAYAAYAARYISYRESAKIVRKHITFEIFAEKLQQKVEVE